MDNKEKRAANKPGLERLQKVLAHAGIDSRRKCEDIILEGRVTVDGKTVTELGTKVDSKRQDIKVDGQPIRTEQHVYFLFNKPRDVLSTNGASAGRLRIVDFFRGRHERLFPVGRLDVDSEGLIVVTNDGEFANRLTHPRYEVPKTYRATVKGRITEKAVAKLRSGIFLSEGKTARAHATVVRRTTNESVVDITIREGRNRQVRRMLANQGFPITRLQRIAIGDLKDSRLSPGEWRPLTEGELKTLVSTALSQPRGRPVRRKRPSIQSQGHTTRGLRRSTTGKRGAKR